MALIYRSIWLRFKTNMILKMQRCRCRHLKYGGGTRRFDLSGQQYDGVRAIMFDDGYEELVKWDVGDDQVWVEVIRIGDEFDAATCTFMENFDQQRKKSCGMVEIVSDDWPQVVLIRTTDKGLIGYSRDIQGPSRIAARTIMESSVYIDPNKPTCDFSALPDTMAVVRYTKAGARAVRYSLDERFCVRLWETEYKEWGEKLCKPLI